MVQRRAARFVKGRYGMYESVTQMLEELTWVLRVRRVRKIYFDNEKHDIEETNTETFMCRSMSATDAYTKL